MAKVRERKREMVAAQVAAHLQNYKASGAELIMGNGRFVGPKTLEVSLNKGGVRTLVGDRIFLNVGTHALIPAVPGLEATKPLTHVEALELDVLPAIMEEARCRSPNISTFLSSAAEAAASLRPGTWGSPGGGLRSSSGGGSEVLAPTWPACRARMRFEAQWGELPGSKQHEWGRILACLAAIHEAGHCRESQIWVAAISCRRAVFE